MNTISTFEPYNEAKVNDAARLALHRLGLADTATVELQPGNGTRYEMLLSLHRTRDGDSLGVIMPDWGSGFAFGLPGGFCHYSYAQEKLGLRSESDARVIGHFITAVRAGLAGLDA